MGQNVGFLPTAANELLNRREGGFGRAAKDEITVIMISDGADHVVARIATIKEQDCSSTNGSYQAEGFFALGAVNTGHRSGHRDAPEHVIGGCDQTLGIVSLALMVETALRIELQAILRCCGQVVLGPVDGND